MDLIKGDRIKYRYNEIGSGNNTSDKRKTREEWRPGEVAGRYGYFYLLDLADRRECVLFTELERGEAEIKLRRCKND